MLTESLWHSDACICEVGEVEGVGCGAQRVWLEFHTVLSPAQWRCLVLQDTPLSGSSRGLGDTQDPAHSRCAAGGAPSPPPPVYSCVRRVVVN